MNDLLKLFVVTLVAGLIGGFVGGLVGDNQTEPLESVGASGTRFPNGLSADSTSPIPGQVRGTTLSLTGAAVILGQLNSLTSVETITADDTLTVAESGKTIFIGTAGVDLTLPAAASSAGVYYKVVMSANFATTNMTVTGGAADASDDLIQGVLDVAGAVVLCANEDTVSFVNTAELVGDYVTFVSDGTNWLMQGQAGATGAITCTDAD